MDVGKCAEARARLAEASGNLATNSNGLSAASVAHALAVSTRSALSLTRPDVAALKAQKQAAQDAMLVIHGQEDPTALAAQVAQIGGQIEKAEAEVAKRDALDAEISDLEGRIRDAQHQIEVATSRVNEAQTDIALYCQ